MLIVWDEPKRISNLAKHGLDFATVTLEFFLNSRVATAQKGRLKAIGELEDQTVIVVVFRPLGSEGLSIISMRRASKKERQSV